MSDGDCGPESNDAGDDGSEVRIGRSVSRCPRCDSPITAVSIIGPDDQFVSPCGCRLTPGQIERL
ncbi:hypothetical protein [Natrononativus amylolyticus]|uniref:hypothetical protein n=1 Tax=Natrononativus amylolyticus TaxID=2963434 RepID=UPI0020CBDD9D|nr:hypothetical protein [Natrononativus amylolyticus]